MSLYVDFWVCVWTCEFLFGRIWCKVECLVKFSLFGQGPKVDVTNKKKHKQTYMMTCWVAAQLKTTHDPLNAGPTKLLPKTHKTTVVLTVLTIYFWRFSSLQNLHFFSCESKNVINAQICSLLVAHSATLYSMLYLLSIYLSIYLCHTFLEMMSSFLK